MKKAILILCIIIGILVLAIGGLLLGKAIANRGAENTDRQSFTRDKSDNDKDDKDDASQTRRNDSGEKPQSSDSEDEYEPTEESEIAFDPSESEDEERRRQEEEQQREEESRRAEESRQREEEESRQREEEARRDREEQLNAAAMAAYKVLLQDVHDHPNDYVDYYDSNDAVEGMEYNNFGFYDINSDGIDELILLFTNTYVAAMKSLAYTYNDVTDRAELLTEDWLGAYIVFYDGGYCTMAAYHNHTYGSLWPYTLYRWSNVEKRYVALYTFYSCVKEYDQYGNYDEDADLDGDGEVYLIHDDTADEDAIVVDKEEYEAFVQIYISEYTRIDLEWWTITPENIENLI